MLHLYAVVEHARPSEDQIVGAYLVVLLGIFASVEPHQVQNACAVREMSHHTLAARSHLKGLKAEYVADDLHERHVARQLTHLVDFCAVNVFIGVVVQQVAIGVNAEFLAQHLLAVGPYARQVHDVLLEDVHFSLEFKSSSLLCGDRRA